MHAKHVLRVAGFLGDDAHHQGFEIHCSRYRRSGSGSCCGSECRASRGTHVLNDLTEGAQGGQFGRLHFRQVGRTLAHRGKDFDALDAVDTEIGLQFHVRAEHFLRIAGFLSDDVHHQGFKVERGCGRQRSYRGNCSNRFNDWHSNLNGGRQGRDDGNRAHYRRWGRGVMNRQAHMRHRCCAAHYGTQTGIRRLGSFEEGNMTVSHRTLIGGVCVGGLALRLLKSVHPGQMSLGSYPGNSRNHYWCNCRRLASADFCGSRTDGHRYGGNRNSARRVGRRQIFCAARGRVGPAGITAVDGHGHRRLLHRFIRRRGKLFPQRREIHRYPRQREAAKTFLQGGDTVLALAIQADGTMRTIAENAPDQFGQYAAGADFDKRAHAAGIHRLDLFDEADRLRELSRQLFADRRRLLRIGFCSSVAIHVELRRIELHALQKLTEWHAGPRHQRAVEGGGNGQALGGHALRGQRGFELGDFLYRTGEYYLGRRIVVGHHHVGTAFSDCGANFFNGLGHGGHRTRYCRCITHQLATATGDLDQARGVKHTGFVQGRHFAETVAGNARRANANRMKHVGQ